MKADRRAMLAIIAAWLGRPGAESKARRALKAAVPPELAVSVRAHGIAAVSLAVAERLGGSRELIKLLREAARVETARGLLLEGELESLAAAARERGLKALLFKGIAFDRVHYPQPGTRPASDIDLLVLDEQRSEWEQLLVSLGYEKMRWVDRTWRRPSRATVDLHFKSSDLVGVIDVPDRLSPVRLDMQALFSRAERYENLALPAPCFEDHLVLSAAHGMGVHVYEKLVWVLDLAVLCGRITDPDALVSAARECRADRLLYDSLEMIRLLDLADPPHELMKALRPSRRGRIEKVMVRKLARRGLPDRSQYLLALALPSPPGYRRELLRKAFRPSQRSLQFGETGRLRGMLAHVSRLLRISLLAAGF